MGRVWREIERERESGKGREKFQTVVDILLTLRDSALENICHTAALSDIRFSAEAKVFPQFRGEQANELELLKAKARRFYTAVLPCWIHGQLVFVFGFV